MTMAGANFCSDGEAAIHRNLTLIPSSVTEADNLKEIYEIDKCINWITTKSFNKVGNIFTYPIIAYLAHVLSYINNSYLIRKNSIISFEHVIQNVTF